MNRNNSVMMKIFTDIQVGTDLWRQPLSALWTLNQNTDSRCPRMTQTESIVRHLSHSSLSPSH